MAQDMANREELTGSRIVIESVCGERGGILFGIHSVRVHAEKETFFFFFQMTRRYQRASHFVSRRWLWLLNADNSNFKKKHVESFYTCCAWAGGTESQFVVERKLILT
jgi:hypothetical protein